MEKSTFLNQLQHPLSYTLQEKLDIQNAKTHYPYCALLQKLDLLSDKAASIYQWKERFLCRVALHLPQPEQLLTLIPQVRIIEISTPADLKLKQRIEEGKRQESAIEESGGFDIMNEINAYQEVSFKTAPKSEILSQFLEVGGVKTDKNASEKPLSVEEMAKKSKENSGAVVTETMAVVFEKQGKFDKAIDIYEKLIVKNPGKSSTFAARIEELKTKLN